MSHFLSIPEKPVKMAEVVGENMQEAQRQKKLCYDGHARVQDFSVGDQVLVLLPSSTNKLQHSGKDPTQLLDELVESIIAFFDMNDKRKRYCVFDINMIKKWHIQPETAFSVKDLHEVDGQEDEVQVWNCMETESEDMPKINGDLTHKQCQENQALLEESPDVLSAKPGRTAPTKHTIVTK